MRLPLRKVTRPPFQGCVVVLLFLLAFGLRLHNYWIIPLSDETADEIAWTWLGSSLLKDHVPSSWSYYGEYQPDHIFQEGPLDAPIVRPAVDHPPLFSLLPGSIHALTSENWAVIPSRKIIRLPMVFLGTLNVILLYFVAKKVLKEWWSVVVTAVYGTAPLFVFASRLVVAENLIVTWSLLVVLVLAQVLESKKSSTARRWEVALIVLSVAAAMSKISGFVVPLSLIIFAVAVKDKRLIKVGCGAIVAAIGVLIGYMSLFNLPLFLAIQQAQSGRELGLITLYQRFFVHPVVAELVYFDGWLVLGFISLVTALADFSQQQAAKVSKVWHFIVLVLVLNLGFMLVTAGQYSYHGWYSYALFPFFALTITQLFKKAWEGASYLFGLVWILWLPTLALALSYASVLPGLSNLTLRASYGVGFLPVLFGYAQQEKYRRLAMVILLCCIFIFNCVVVVKISEVALRAQHDAFFFYLQQ